MIAITALIGIGISNIPMMVLGASCVTIPQLLTATLKPNSYGGADIKIMAACSFLLGLERGLVAIIVGLLLVVIVTITIRKIQKKDLKDTFPIVPYLAIGCSRYSCLFYFPTHCAACIGTCLCDVFQGIQRNTAENQSTTTGDYESALTRLESRVGSEMLSDVVHGLISVLRGDNTTVYWATLSVKFADIQRQHLKQQAQLP